VSSEIDDAKQIYICMAEEVLYYLTNYGYLAIFFLIFLQEIGMPNIFPNEILLIFSGFLSIKGILSLPLVIITAITADFFGTNLLFFLFYYSGPTITLKLGKWIPSTLKRIESFGNKVKNGGVISIYLFRITPFTRGYTSVITGLFRMNPSLYVPIVLISSVLWSSFYIMLGWILGPSWDLSLFNTDKFRVIMITVFIIMISSNLWINLLAGRNSKKGT
jgi:membrane protein DedA with SNARE-associated domain